MNLLITGATGALGPPVVDTLIDAGHTVCLLVRDPRRAGTASKAANIRVGDILNRDELVAAMSGCDAVVHMAALLHIVDPDPALSAAYQEVNVGGTANVVAAAQEHGVGRLVFASTIAVYGYNDGRVLTEDASPRPDSLYGRTKLDAEHLVLQARRVDGNPLGVVLRFAAVYGPGMKGNYRRLIQALARRRFIPVGTGENRRTLVHERDVARAVLLALEHPQALGRVYNVTDGEIHPLHGIMAAMCDALGQRPPKLHVPVASARAAAGAVDRLGGLLGSNRPSLRAGIDKYVEDVAVSGARMQQELGFSPEVDLVSGWRETVDALRASGAL